MQAVDINLVQYRTGETESADKAQNVKKTDAEPVHTGNSFLAMLEKLVAVSNEGELKSFEAELQGQEEGREAGFTDFFDDENEEFFDDVEKNTKEAVPFSKNTDKKPATEQKKEAFLNGKEKSLSKNGYLEKKFKKFEPASFEKNDLKEDALHLTPLSEKGGESERVIFSLNFETKDFKPVEKKEKIERRKEVKEQDVFFSTGTALTPTRSEKKAAVKKTINVQEKEVGVKKTKTKQGKPVITIEDLRLKAQMQQDSVHKAGVETRVDTDNTFDLTIDFRGKVQEGLFSSGKETAQFANEAKNTGQGITSMLAQEIRNASADFVQAGKIVLRDNNAGEIRLQLKPENLGNVKIHLKLADGKKVNGVVTVTTKEAYKAFEENLDTLTKEFRENGFEAAEFSLSWSDSSSKEPSNSDFEFDGKLFAKNEANDLREAEKNADKLNVYGYIYGSTVDILA